MASGGYRFERFVLDLAGRRLTRDGAPMELNARYFDALALLVREAGELVSKDRFLDEVWHGVPVTDEALTQCVKTLRRQLGDDAARPRFIETVPKHGYRFIARVSGGAAAGAAAPFHWRERLLLGAAGTAGGGVAGMVGGLFYGFAGTGGLSVLAVLVCLTALIGLAGGAGVGFGIAAAGFGSVRPWASILGGAGGGLLVGAAAKLLGLDAFNLLFGRSPGDITGAAEGALLGAAIGFGTWLGSRGAPARHLRRGIAGAALAAGGAGLLIPLLGGRLMGGSLDLLARRFPGSQLRLEEIGALFGEPSFGPISQMATGGLEGLLFGGGVAGALILARRRLADLYPSSSFAA